MMVLWLVVECCTSGYHGSWRFLRVVATSFFGRVDLLLRSPPLSSNLAMVRNSAPELSEFERKRQENIARNKILLGELVLTATETGLAPKKRKLSSTLSSASKKAKRSSPKPKENVQPTRTSSRLRNIPADSEVARLRAEEERQAQQAAERAKKQRISDDVDFSALPISGKRCNISNDTSKLSDKLLTSCRTR